VDALRVERKRQPVTKYIKHAGTVDDYLLIWSAGTFYIQALWPIVFKMRRLTIILTFVSTFYCLIGNSQTHNIISIDKIVKTIENDKGLNAVSVTDEKYLEKMEDFNGGIVGYFRNKELVKISVYSTYGNEIYEYCYYLVNDKPVYCWFHASEYDGTEYVKLDKTKLKLIRGDRMYLINNKIFDYRSFSNGKWTKVTSDAKDVMNRNQNILDDIVSFKSGLKNSWPQQLHKTYAVL
jgi:hypothetical protein